MKKLISFTLKKIKASEFYIIEGIISILFLMLTGSVSSFGQGVGINNPVPHAKSLLDLTATDKGLLIPRMTQAQRIAIFPVTDATAKGMLVYQTDAAAGFYYYDGSAWQFLGNENTGWSVTGNTGTNAATHFIGTTDAQPLMIKTNNTLRMKVNVDGRIEVLGNNHNLTIGASAGNSSFSGTYNTIIGELAGFNGTTGSYNTFEGYQSGRNNNSDYNTFYGYNSGVANNTGVSNTFIGMAAGVSNTSGSYNVNIGHSAGSNNTIGNSNIIIGYYAGLASTNASENVMIGRNSGSSTTASDNTFLGSYSGITNTTGNQNTFIGANAKGDPVVSKSVAIGNNAFVAANNSLVLGGTGVDAVKVGIGVTAPSAELEVNGYTKLGSSAPAVKMVKFTGTTAAVQGSSVSIAHGLNSAKILSVSLLIEYAAGSSVPASYMGSPGFESHYYITPAALYVINQAGNSANILSKSYKVLITYEQ